MTLAEATSKFVQRYRQNDSSVESSAEASSKVQILVQSLELLTTYFSRTDALEDVTADRLRDFLARFYIEKALSSCAPEPKALLGSLARFFRWADQYAGTKKADQYLPLIRELEQTIPCALELTQRLSKEMAGRGGAFSFPEFLASFEEGGQSQYDLDAPGEVSAIEGYFRITRVEGSSVEAEETISEDRIWPIIFPASVVSFICVGMVINLELVRAAEGWQIAASGFAYPPGAKGV